MLDTQKHLQIRNFNIIIIFQTKNKSLKKYIICKNNLTILSRTQNKSVN